MFWLEEGLFWFSLGQGHIRVIGVANVLVGMANVLVGGGFVLVASPSRSYQGHGGSFGASLFTF